MPVSEKYRTILSQCVPIGACLVWQGPVDRDGYAKIYIDGKHQILHRVVYEHFNGKIPTGLTIDHVWARGCKHKNCINIAHLEAVTNTENILRSDSPTAINARKEMCDKGHPFETDAHGLRMCRICARERWRRYQARKKRRAK